MEGRIISSNDGQQHDQLNNISAELKQSWHIPRPTLARSSNSSKGSASSNNSTQSAKSGSQLLTAANLAQIHRQDFKSQRQQNINYYLQQSGGDGQGDAGKTPGSNIINNNNSALTIPCQGIGKGADLDTVSIASSMHFTVVNVAPHSRSRPAKRSFCAKHQLTILIVSMSILFTFGILAAIYFVEMRVRSS